MLKKYILSMALLGSFGFSSCPTQYLNMSNEEFLHVVDNFSTKVNVDKNSILINEREGVVLNLCRNLRDLNLKPFNYKRIKAIDKLLKYKDLNSYEKELLYNALYENINYFKKINAKSYINKPGKLAFIGIEEKQNKVFVLAFYKYKNSLQSYSKYFNKESFYSSLCNLSTNSKKFYSSFLQNKESCNKYETLEVTQDYGVKNGYYVLSNIKKYIIVEKNNQQKRLKKGTMVKVLESNDKLVRFKMVNGNTLYQYNIQKFIRYFTKLKGDK